MIEKKEKNSNQGFTLVEVLVAVVVLAIVVIPLLNSFFSAARANAKAKKLMDATTAAQNIFEELKGEKLEDFITAHTETSQKIMKSDNVTPQLDEQGKEMFRHILPDTSHPENFRVTVDERTFLARVTVDPLTYTTKAGETKKKSDYNSQLFAKLSKMSPSTNGFYIQAANLDDLGAAGLAPDNMPSSVETTKNSMTRTITIDIDYNAANGLCEAFATITYSDAAGGSFSQLVKDQFYSNSSALSNKLTNIFVCFMPMYSPAGTKLAPKEKIVINNPMNYPVNIYLVKQTELDDTANMAYKNNYSVGLEVNEGNRVWDKPVTSVTTNLRYTEGNEIASELTSVALNGPTSQPSTRTEALDIVDDLSRPQAGLRIYKVKVEIFEKDDDAYAKALTTMEGTKIE